MYFSPQQLNKRHLRRSRSLVSLLLWGGGLEDEDGKAKNIKQTELLVDLREAILQIARHFQSLDPKNNKVVSLPDTHRHTQTDRQSQTQTDRASQTQTDRERESQTL